MTHHKEIVVDITPVLNAILDLLHKHLPWLTPNEVIEAVKQAFEEMDKELQNRKNLN